MVDSISPALMVPVDPTKRGVSDEISALVLNSVNETGIPFLIPQAVLNNTVRPQNLPELSEEVLEARKKGLALDLLPNEVFVMILDRAALTDRIILALTCKTLARKIKCLPGARSIKTETSNTPVYIGVDYVFPKNERKNRPEARLSRTKFAFFSTQRLNLLRLQPAMPPNFRLCWRCLKYTPIWNSTWISTNLTSVFAEPEHKAIITPMLPSRIWAHKRCVDNWKDLREICFNEPGASYISDLTPSSQFPVDVLFKYRFRDIEPYMDEDEEVRKSTFKWLYLFSEKID